MSIKINEIVGFASKASKSSYELYQYPYEWPYPDLSAIIGAMDASLISQQNINMGPGRNYASGNTTLSAENPTITSFVPSDPVWNTTGVYTRYWYEQIVLSEQLDQLPRLTNTTKYNKKEISCLTYTLVDHPDWVGVGYDCHKILQNVVPGTDSLIPPKKRQITDDHEGNSDWAEINECVSDRDCRHGLMCLHGQCVQSDGPIDDVDIIPIPDDDIGLIENLPCRTDRDCRPGMVCYRNQCILEPLEDPVEILPQLCWYNGSFVCGTNWSNPEPTTECVTYNANEATCNNSSNSHGEQCVWCPNTSSNCVSITWLEIVQEIFENIGSSYECFDAICGCGDPIAMNYCPSCIGVSDQTDCSEEETECDYTYPNNFSDNVYGGYIEVAGDEGLDLTIRDIWVRLHTDAEGIVAECKLPIGSIPAEASVQLPWYLVLLTDDQGNDGEGCYVDQYGIHTPFILPNHGTVSLKDYENDVLISYIGYEVPVWKPDFGFARTMNMGPTDSYNSIFWEDDYQLHSVYSKSYWNYICSYSYCNNKSTPGSENLMRSIDSENSDGNWTVSCDGMCGNLEALDLALNPVDNWLFGECYCNQSCINTFNCCHDYNECPAGIPQNSKIYIWYGNVALPTLGANFDVED